MLDRESDDVRAIVVGIDHYEYGDQWDLNGPTRDALNTVQWLFEQGVPEKNIALFLAPRSWDDADVRALVASRPKLVQRVATDRELTDYINEELPDLGGEALLVHWGGHGVVGDREAQQYMYTANAGRGRPYCVCAEELTVALADRRFLHLRHQVLIFDVCANQAVASEERARLTPTRFVTSVRDAGIAQCRIYGASLGHFAANSPERGTGLFSELLFRELQHVRGPGLRQFGEVFAALERDAEQNGLSKQRPLIRLPGEHELPGTTARLTSAQEQLFERISALDPAAAHLDRLYLQALSHVDPKSTPAALEQRLFDLKDTRPQRAGYPLPLVEFTERLGRELGVSDLCEWARAQCGPGQYRALQAKLDEEDRVASKETVTLFIEVEKEDAPQFSWWLEGPGLPATSREAVDIDGNGLYDTLVRTLPEILAFAEKRVRHLFEPRIGFILPIGFLLAGLERIHVKPEDPQDGPVPLNELYPVLFHWVQRTLHSGTRDVNNWARLTDILAPRAARGHGTAVIWLGEGAVDERARYVRASDALLTGPEAAVCLGIEQLPDELAKARLDTIRQCLKAGVPCLFWFQQPAEAGDANVLRERVNQAFARHTPRKVAVSFLNAQRGVDTAGRFGIDSLLWDLPSHLPAHTPNQSLFEDHP